jgi:Sigma-70, region 4
MKQIGEEIGVNESRVSQLHARAMQRLRSLLSTEPAPATPVAAVKRPPRAARARSPRLLPTVRRKPIAATLEKETHTQPHLAVA